MNSLPTTITTTTTTTVKPISMTQNCRNMTNKRKTSIEQIQFTETNLASFSCLGQKSKYLSLDDIEFLRFEVRLGGKIFSNKITNVNKM